MRRSPCYWGQIQNSRSVHVIIFSSRLVGYILDNPVLHNLIQNQLLLIDLLVFNFLRYLRIHLSYLRDIHLIEVPWVLRHIFLCLYQLKHRELLSLAPNNIKLILLDLDIVFKIVQLVINELLSELLLEHFLLKMVPLALLGNFELDVD